MNSRKSINILIISLVLVFLPVGISADIWQRHINSNHADQLLCNDKEIWVRPNGGGLTRWDVSTGKYERFFDVGNGLPSSEIRNMLYDDQGRLIVHESYTNFLIYENGKFNFLTKAPVYPETICFENGKLYGGFWYSNYKGLSYFDGTDWIPVPEFSNYEVYGIAGDKNGGIWVSERYRENSSSSYIPNVIYYKDGKLTYYSCEEVTGSADPGFNSLIAKNMVVDSGGIVWACLSAGVAWFDGDKWQHYSWIDEIKEGFPPYPTNVVRTKDGIVYVSDGNGGLRMYDGENWSKVTEYEDSKVLYVENNPDKGIWVGTSTGLELFDGTNRNRYFIENLFPISNQIMAIDINPDGNLWCGDMYGDLAMLDVKNWKTFHGAQLSDLQNYSPGALKDLAMSNFSGIWAAFNNDVLNYKGNIWLSYADDFTDKMDQFSCIKEAPDGSMWLGSNWNPVIAKWSGSEWEFITLKGVNGVSEMTFDSDGKLWLASFNSSKIMTWDGNNLTTILSQDDFPEIVFQPYTISSMNNGTIWIGTTYQIIVLQDGKIINRFDADDGLPYTQPPSGPKSVDISAIRQAQDGSIWVLSSYGLSVYDGSQFHAYTEFFHIGSGLGKDLVIRSDGRIFTVSETGILEFTPTFVTLKMSLFADQIAYKAGDKLNLSLMVNNYGPDETGDLYFVMLAPDGKLYSGLDWSQGVRPAASNFTIPADYSLPLTKIMSLTLPSATPPLSQPGKYYFMIALADSGTTYLRSKTIVTIDAQ